MLNIASTLACFALDQLKLHRNAGSDGAITLPGKSSKMKEHIVIRSLLCDHAHPCLEVKPVHNPLRDFQAVGSQRRCAMRPLLLGYANLPHCWRIVRLVAVIGAAFHDGAQVVPQFLVGGPTDKVPSVIDSVDAQVWSQHKRVRLSAIGVLALRLVKHAELLDDDALFVRQEGPLRPQPGAKGGLHEWRVSAHRCQLAVIDSQFVLELYQLPHLLLITWAEEPAIKDEDQWIAIQETQMSVEEAGLREVCEPCQLVLMIRQFNIGKLVIHLKIGGHKHPRLS